MAKVKIHEENSPFSPAAAIRNLSKNEPNLFTIVEALSIADSTGLCSKSTQLFKRAICVLNPNL
jgi:hypothetical protein